MRNVRKEDVLKVLKLNPESSMLAFPNLYPIMLLSELLQLGPRLFKRCIQTLLHLNLYPNVVNYLTEIWIEYHQ